MQDHWLLSTENRSNEAVYNFVKNQKVSSVVLEPNTLFEDLLHPCEKVIFAFERSYITSAMRKSMLDVPMPGSF